MTTSLNKKDRELIMKIAKKQGDQGRQIMDHGKEIGTIKKQLAELFSRKLKVNADDGMNKINIKFKGGRISTPQMDQVITKAMAEAITGLCEQLGIDEIDVSYREKNKGRQT